MLALLLVILVFLTLQCDLPQIFHTGDRDNDRDDAKLVICGVIILKQTNNNLTYKKIPITGESNYVLTGPINK